MPPTPTASKPPKGKGAGKGLGKKVGPFSLWVWLVMGGAVVVVGYLYLRNRGQGDGGGGFVETVTGNQTASPEQQAYGGGPSGGASDGLASQVDPSTLQALIDQSVQPYLASAGDLRGHVYELEDAFANAGYTQNEDKTWTPPDLFSGDAQQNATVDATLGAPGAAPRPAGVKWGGQTFTTRAGIAAYLSGTQQGKPRAQAYRQWATKHPGAAKQLTGPAPKPRSPVKKQAPPPKAKPKPAPKKPAQKKVKVQAQKKKVRR